MSLPGNRFPAVESIRPSRSPIEHRPVVLSGHHGWRYLRTLRRNKLVVPGVRKENRQNRCENRDGRVGREWATPMARLLRRPSVGPRGHRFDESITLPRHRLNVSRARALVAKDRSEAADDDVEAVMKVDVPVGGDEPLRRSWSPSWLARCARTPFRPNCRASFRRLSLAGSRFCCIRRAFGPEEHRRRLAGLASEEARPRSQRKAQADDSRRVAMQLFSAVDQKSRRNAMMSSMSCCVSRMFESERGTPVLEVNRNL